MNGQDSGKYSLKWVNKMLTIQAPAKLNLTLDVLGKRGDGFHEIRSVFQAINPCDSLRFRSSKNIIVKSDMPDWDATKSLVSRMVGLIQKDTGCGEGATIEVSKCIPLVSGLGGDCSDAVATLLGLSELWKLNLSRGKLLELAEYSGSDLPFFLYGGTALVQGRGEVITPLSPIPSAWFVLVIPNIPRLPGKTAKLYANLQPAHYTDGRITQKLVDRIETGEKLTSDYLFNVFENVAFDCFAGLDEYHERMIRAGADNVHPAGSGPTLFTMVNEKAQAEELSRSFQQQGLKSYMAEALPAVGNNLKKGLG